MYAGELSCSPSGDRSRARLGEPPNLEDLEISTADDQPWDRMPVPARPARADVSTPQASCSSHPLADLMPDTPESDHRLAQVGLCVMGRSEHAKHAAVWCMLIPI